MSTVAKKFKKEALPKLKKEMGVDSDLAVPRIIKVVVNIGTGRFSKEEQVLESLGKALSLVTGQKPEVRPARKSIASFKIRQGAPVGYRVTLRGKKMYDFLDRLINIALPRTRDFRGIDLKSIDERGNLTIGVKEHTIFPELTAQNIKIIFGLEITVVTNAKEKEKAINLFRLLGFPLKNE
jgi:large subunit ribosomal protein L5